MSKKYEGIDWLNRRILFGMKAGLENIQALLREWGNPHEGLRYVHVAGSNGKGSTIALLDFFLRRRGVRTARYHSPHLVSVVERIRINDDFISKDKLDDLLLRVKVKSEMLGLEPTFFESVTCAAFLYFAEEKPDYVLLETGLGGRLDSTNVISENCLAIVTSISLEHTQILGNRLEEILCEKLGIVKPTGCLLTHLPAQLSQLARDYCLKCGVEHHEVRHFTRWDQWTKQLDLTGRGKYFQLNLKTALSAASLLGLSDEELREGCAELPQYSWEGRYQKLFAPGLPLVLLDGAHNLEGIEVLLSSVEEEWGVEVNFVLGASIERNPVEWREGFARFKGELLLPRCSHLKLHAPETIEMALDKGEILESARETFERMKDAASQVWVITGSLYFLSEWILILREYYPQLSLFKDLTPEFNERSHKLN